MIGRWWRRLFLLMIAALATTVTASLVRARRHARDVPLSPLTAGWVVGPEYVERRGVGDGTEPDGEMDDVDVYARPDFDTTELHPDVRDFYEHTSEYDLRYRIHWHRGFRLGASLAARATSRLEQLNLPGPDDETWHRLRSRFVGISPAVDPRHHARAWVRTDPDTGKAVFVAVYATHERDGETFNSIAVPLPWSNLSTVLHLEPLAVDGEDGDGNGGVELTTRPDGDPGLYLVTPLGVFDLPLSQRFRVWPASGDDSPTEDDAIGADGAGDDTPTTLHATHEMWVWGRQFLTIEYHIGRR